jgi:tetratricopeptide (TPR) repeat protein
VERGVRRPPVLDPPIPDDVMPAELPREARAELRAVTKETADLVARHLVMAGRLIGEDPQQAHAHADAARRRLPRIAVVREAVGLCAYANGDWAEALAELRASRRINGSVEHLPVMADCERGLGRPERALALATSADARKLDREGTVEMRIVVAGARRDLGQPDAAVVSLQGADLDPTRRDPWSPRLFYAYADALLAAGRPAEAREWFVAAALADIEGETDASERVDLLDGASPEVVVLDGADPDDESGANAPDSQLQPDGQPAARDASEEPFLLFFDGVSTDER